MKLKTIALIAGVMGLGLSSAWAGPYDKSVVVSGITGATAGISPHGVTGLNFGPGGKLYAGSVIGPGIYRIDVKTGALEEVVGGMAGESDDVAISGDGTLVWTAILSGELRARRPDGAIETLAVNLPMINPVTFTTEGR